MVLMSGNLGCVAIHIRRDWFMFYLANGTLELNPSIHMATES